MYSRIRFLPLILAATLFAGGAQLFFSQGKKLPWAPASKPSVITPQKVVVAGPARIIKEKVEVMIGSLSVTTEPGAAVVLTPARPTGKKLQKMADESGAVIFENPGRGAYRLEVSKPDYETRGEQITIDP